MKVLLFISTLFLISPELALYKNDAYRFEVQFPNEIQEESITQTERFGTVEYLRVTGKETNLSYSVVAARYDTNDTFNKNGTSLQELVFNHSKHINQEGFIKTNFIIVSEKFTKDAIYYVVGSATMDTFMHRKIFIRGNMTYSLSIWSRMELSKENIDTFFNSLKVKAQ